MTRYGQATGYTSKHTGKSGYIATRPGPKPFPYGLAEEAGSAFYPEYRKYIPKDYRKYSDSYYDLRNKPYKEWYDKWGKPTINRYSRWWTKGYAKIQTELQKTQKNNQKFSYTRSGYDKRNNCYRDRNGVHHCKSVNFRSRKRKLKYRSPRQRPYYKRRSSYGYRNY